ncbi:MAG: hypothetical protein EA376_11170 [Phycisphaeraceae bacterium]|nr:MAG: hypothetical protein EA376_11170 [Phycisphaeraceae bacterium]
MKKVNTNLIAVSLTAMSIATGSAAAQSEFRLLQGVAGASGEFWNNPNQSGPSIWSDSNSALLAPPPVNLGSASGGARVQYNDYGPWGPFGATVIPWAEASLSLNGTACGELDITMNVAMNLGRTDILTPGNLSDPNDPLFNTQPDIPWLLSNNIPAFSGSLGAGTNFLLEAIVDLCDVCLPAGIFEVDLDSTPPGTFEPWDGCLPGGAHRLRLLGGGGLADSFDFSWDPHGADGPTLILPNGFSSTWSIQIPAPSTAALAFFGLGFVARRRR